MFNHHHPKLESKNYRSNPIADDFNYRSSSARRNNDIMASLERNARRRPVEPWMGPFTPMQERMMWDRHTEEQIIATPQPVASPLKSDIELIENPLEDNGNGKEKAGTKANKANKRHLSPKKSTLDSNTIFELVKGVEDYEDLPTPSTPLTFFETDFDLGQSAIYKRYIPPVIDRLLVSQALHDMVEKTNSTSLSSFLNCEDLRNAEPQHLIYEQNPLLDTLSTHLPFLKLSPFDIVLHPSVQSTINLCERHLEFELEALRRASSRMESDAGRGFGKKPQRYNDLDYSQADGAADPTSFAAYEYFPPLGAEMKRNVIVIFRTQKNTDTDLFKYQDYHMNVRIGDVSEWQRATCEMVHHPNLPPPHFPLDTTDGVCLTDLFDAVIIDNNVWNSDHIRLFDRSCSDESFVNSNKRVKCYISTTNSTLLTNAIRAYPICVIDNVISFDGLLKLIGMKFRNWVKWHLVRDTMMDPETLFTKGSSSTGTEASIEIRDRAEAFMKNIDTRRTLHSLHLSDIGRPVIHPSGTGEEKYDIKTSYSYELISQVDALIGVNKGSGSLDMRLSDADLFNWRPFPFYNEIEKRREIDDDQFSIWTTALGLTRTYQPQSKLMKNFCSSLGLGDISSIYLPPSLPMGVTEEIYEDFKNHQYLQSFDSEAFKGGVVTYNLEGQKTVDGPNDSDGTDNIPKKTPRGSKTAKMSQNVPKAATKKGGNRSTGKSGMSQSKSAVTKTDLKIPLPYDDPSDPLTQTLLKYQKDIIDFENRNFDYRNCPNRLLFESSSSLWFQKSPILRKKEIQNVPKIHKNTPNLSDVSGGGRCPGVSEIDTVSPGPRRAEDMSTSEVDDILRSLRTTRDLVPKDVPNDVPNDAEQGPKHPKNPQEWCNCPPCLDILVRGMIIGLQAAFPNRIGVKATKVATAEPMYRLK